jgi:hypothetical protein
MRIIVLPIRCCENRKWYVSDIKRPSSEPQIFSCENADLLLNRTAGRLEWVGTS